MANKLKNEVNNGITYEYYDVDALHGTDETLSASNEAANAKVTGEQLTNLNNHIAATTENLNQNLINWNFTNTSVLGISFQINEDQTLTINGLTKTTHAYDGIKLLDDADIDHTVEYMGEIVTISQDAPTEPKADTGATRLWPWLGYGTSSTSIAKFIPKNTPMIIPEGNSLFLLVSKNVNFHNARFQIQIHKGSESLTYTLPNQETAIDYAAREQINLIANKIQPYYEAELRDTVNKVKSETTSPALVFPWVTDIHRYSLNATEENFYNTIRNIKELTKYIPCDFLLNTGDLTDGDQVQFRTILYADDCLNQFIKCNLPYIFACGNHDTNYVGGNGNEYLLTIEECFKAYFRATKNVTFNINENGTEYYLDFENLNTRLIVLNANNVTTQKYGYSYGNSTAQWLSNALDNTKKIIVTMHQSPITSQVVSNQSTKFGTNINSVLNTFVSNGGSLIMLSGHSHKDIAFIAPYLSIMSDCTRFTETTGSQTTPEEATEISGFIDTITKAPRTKGTYTEDLWSVCIYKPFSDELSLIRFGGGADRYFHIAPISPSTVTTKLTGTITWSSSNSEIATVADGTITGISSGKCAILAKDEIGNYECWIVNIT